MNRRNFFRSIAPAAAASASVAVVAAAPKPSCMDELMQNVEKVAQASKESFSAWLKEHEKDRFEHNGWLVRWGGWKQQQGTICIDGYWYAKRLAKKFIPCEDDQNVCPSWPLSDSDYAIGTTSGGCALGTVSLSGYGYDPDDPKVRAQLVDSTEADKEYQKQWSLRKFLAFLDAHERKIAQHAITTG